eukprot:365190-Chlamydomonas_euryale.AAC.15
MKLGGQTDRHDGKKALHSVWCDAPLPACCPPPSVCAQIYHRYIKEIGQCLDAENPRGKENLDEVRAGGTIYV